MRLVNDAVAPPAATSVITPFRRGLPSLVSDTRRSDTSARPADGWLQVEVESRNAK